MPMTKAALLESFEESLHNSGEIVTSAICFTCESSGLFTPIGMFRLEARIQRAFWGVVPFPIRLSLAAETAALGDRFIRHPQNWEAAGSIR